MLSKIHVFKIFLFLICFSKINAFEKVYLASYPQSGSQWLRYIIEEATGFATGSVYFEPNHLEEPFFWGGYAAENGLEGSRRYPEERDTVFVKTHFPTYAATPFDLMYPYQAIRIVRHPIDCFYSFYLKLTHNAPPTRNIPRPVLLQFIKSWREFQEYWDSEEMCINILFEDLVKDPFNILKKAFKQARLPISDIRLRRAIDRYPPIGDPFKYYPFYRYEDFKIIEENLGDLLEFYGYDIN